MGLHIHKHGYVALYKSSSNFYMELRTPNSYPIYSQLFPKLHFRQGSEKTEHGIICNSKFGKTPLNPNMKLKKQLLRFEKNFKEKTSNIDQFPFSNDFFPNHKQRI